MMGMIFIPIIVYILFWVVMEYYFYKDESNEVCEVENVSVKCCIIICAFNEEKNIQNCLQNITEQNFDKNTIEIIVVDDGSYDNTFEVAKRILEGSGFCFRIIRNEKNIGKKRSIEKAINEINRESEWIILRDADTYTKSSNWLKTLINSKTKNADLVIAPVIVNTDKINFLNSYEYYENLALMHLNYSSWKLEHPILCNAANMAFKKEVFLELQPYKDNYTISSGDDIFLLQKFYKSRKRIINVFCSESIVYTYLADSVKKRMLQKWRWISKINAVSDGLNTFVALLIALVNVFILLLLMISLKAFILYFILKMIVDLKIVITVQKKLRLNDICYTKFFIAEVVYIPYVCALIFIYIYRTIRK
ncbi:MAG: glycosyl transferase [Bacteroidia bacterium]|nr:MAG: glycosyl transferase [Bacteroidia bacterium]